MPAKTRDKHGKWAKGTSGNVKGRPAGSRHRATTAALQLLEGESEALTRKAVELALAGDATALRLCMERIVPPIKERHIPALALPTVENIADLPKLANTIMQIIGHGQLTPAEVSKLIQLIDTSTRMMMLQADKTISILPLYAVNPYDDDPE